MPSAPQGLVSFDGVNALMSASYTLTHGTSPGTCTLVIPPQATNFRKISNLIFSYGAKQIVLADCIVDKVTLTTARDGRKTWTLRILDRRWKWKQTGKISGFYNVRADEESLIEETRKTPQDLAKLCLDAMNEARYDVSRMPNKALPQIAWDYTNPAEALSSLCDSLGCRVVLGINDRVSIHRVGHGAPLPLGLDVTDNSMDADPAERPDSLVYVAGKTQYQFDFELEAVGLDIANVIRPIDFLTYKPLLEDGRRTWKTTDTVFYGTVEEKWRERAKQTVFRWYRIKQNQPMNLPLANEDVSIGGFQTRILPLLTHQVETWETEDGTKQPRPPWVYGVFSPNDDAGENSVDEIDDDLDNVPQNLYTGSFVLDTELGIVKFAQPVYRWKEVANGIGNNVLPAKLKLRVAVNLRHPDTRAWHRAEFTRKLGGPKANTLPRYIRRDDIPLAIHRKRGRNSKIKTNQKRVEEFSAYYLDASEDEYKQNSPGSISYAGLKRLAPDGAIQQVTWSISRAGFATTRASRNKEELDRVPSFAETRFIQKANASIDAVAVAEAEALSVSGPQGDFAGGIGFF